MSDFKRILIGLDFTDLDQNVIEYVECLTQKMEIEKMYFIHVARDMEVFKQLQSKDVRPIDEVLLDEVQDQVKQYFINYEQFEIAYKVVEGSPSKQLLHWAEIKEVDLMILGRKPLHRGRGIVPEQIVRNSTCSVFLIPEKASKKCDTVVVPTDFSPYSKSALEMGLKLAQGQERSSVYPINLYDIPFFETGARLDFNTAEPLIKSAVIQEYNQFIHDLDFKGVDVSPNFQANYDARSASHVLDFATYKEADLIVMGSQGKTGLKRLFLGSFAEKIVQENESIPLLIWKNTAHYRQTINSSAVEFNNYMHSGRKRRIS